MIYLLQVCFEKRLVISHDLEPLEGSSAYGELGDIHRLLSNYEQEWYLIVNEYNFPLHYSANNLIYTLSSK